MVPEKRLRSPQTKAFFHGENERFEERGLRIEDGEWRMGIGDWGLENREWMMDEAPWAPFFLVIGWSVSPATGIYELSRHYRRVLRIFACVETLHRVSKSAEVDPAKKSNIVRIGKIS